MATTIIPVPKTLNLHQGNVAENWKKFKAAWSNYELASGISEKKSEVKVATLLSIIGEDAVELYESFQWTKPEDKVTIKTVLDKFEEFCLPRSNVLFETFKFGSRRQEAGETVDNYVVALRRMADRCEFADKDR